MTSSICIGACSALWPSILVTLLAHVCKIRRRKHSRQVESAHVSVRGALPRWTVDRLSGRVRWRTKYAERSSVPVYLSGAKDQVTMYPKSGGRPILREPAGDYPQAGGGTRPYAPIGTMNSAQIRKLPHVMDPGALSLLPHVATVASAGWAQIVGSGSSEIWLFALERQASQDQREG